MSIKIATSILSCDFAHMADEIARIEESGADMIHIDVMDGHFVQNLTMGSAIVSAIRRNTKLYLDVHLMIYQPFSYIERFVKAGANRITFHIEATEDVQDTLDFIKKCNIEVGIAISPESPISMVLPYLPHIDSLLIMTVHPGFGGQQFLEKMLEKVSFIRDWVKDHSIRTPAGSSLEIQVDGGINLETTPLCYQAGATEFVSGSFLFASSDMKRAVAALREGTHE